MRFGRLMLASVLVLGLIYLAWPYATLYRISTAIQDADCAALDVLVDWHAVREGIKEDICDLVQDDPAPQNAAVLPGFGAGFMRGVAASVIDRKVTPQALLALASASSVAAGAPMSTAAADLSPPLRQSPLRQPPAALGQAAVQVIWAFFSSPTVFTVTLRGQGHADPVTVEMVLTGATWRVDRVWLPPALLAGPGAHI